MSADPTDAKSRKKSLAEVLYEMRVAPDELYFDALGRFVDAFATAEAAIQLVLWYYAKLKTSVARSLLSGVRADDAMNRIRRLVEAGEVDPTHWADLEPILQQFNLINGVRNDILHYGAQTAADGSRYVTNAMKAHIEKKITVFPISTPILKEMTEDVRKIIVHLHAHHMGRPPLRGALNIARQNAILLAPWRYKSPQQQPAKSQNQDAKTRSPKDQPKSSQGKL